jgi:hypothetical protein
MAAAMALPLLAPAAEAPSVTGERLFISYAAKPDPRAVLAHNLCILDPAAEFSLEPGHALGHTYLAYVSTVEVAPDSPAAKSAQARGIPILGKNPGWNSGVLDITHAAWEDWLIEDVVQPAISKGYDGVFLDTLDSVMRITSERPTAGPACREALVRAIKRIDQQFPGKRIVLNRGFLFLETLGDAVDGVLVESLFQTWSPEKKTYSATRVEGSEWLLHHIAIIQAKKLPVYVVDYVPVADEALARATAERIRERGCIPFITTPDLKGESLAPLREVPRRVAVLHGWKPKAQARPSFPADTLTSALFQAPLEWLGCEVEFIDAAKGVPPDLSPLRYRGLLLDGELRLPVEREDTFADWILSQQQRGVRVLFTGTIPFTRQAVVRRMFDALAMTGDNQPLPFSEPPQIVAAESNHAEVDLPARLETAGHRAVRAPVGAKVLLSLQGRDTKGRALRSDAVFLAPWGGALLLHDVPDPAIRRLDLHAFFASWMNLARPFPVPDVTTRDGMRSFYAHMGGDGFVSHSSLEGKPLCAEVIRDKVLGAHPLPITVSVIEAEIEAHVSGQDPADAPRFRELARSIFALPNVQAASHSYSHPFRWLEDDAPAGTTSLPRNLPLKPWANYDERVNIEREVRGSVEYINRVLLPRDKQVELMLWSGDSRPGAEALRLCREMRMEDLGTRTSRDRAGKPGAVPRHTFWDGEMQVYASNDSDALCLGDRPGSNFSSYENMTDAFTRTESPRRLAPVNVCASFASANYLTSLNALERILGWCMDQPLHAITARQHAQMVRDAYTAGIYESGGEKWIISCEGQARTFRLPATAKDPDVALSNGVTGWIRHGDSLYLHTRGFPVTELVLSAEPAPHLRLVKCSAEIEFSNLEATKAEFRVSDLRPVRVSFAGAPPHASCELVVNGQSMRLQSDAQGFIALSLPATAAVTLDFSAARYATSY